MNISDARAKAVSLTQAGKYRILWRHIRERGHEVSEFEIKMVLLHGRHDSDKEEEDRYVAFGRLDQKNIRVVYEFTQISAEEYVLVITAFID